MIVSNYSNINRRVLIPTLTAGKRSSSPADSKEDEKDDEDYDDKNSEFVVHFNM